MRVSIRECRSTMGGESAPPQMEVAHRAHGGTGRGVPVIVLAVTPIATMPGVGTLHHPAWRQRRDPFAPWRTCRPLHVPRWTMVCPPGVERLRVLGRLANDRFAPGTVWRLELREQYRGRRARIAPRPKPRVSTTRGRQRCRARHRPAPSS
jgi:hypothetical protein